MASELIRFSVTMPEDLLTAMDRHVERRGTSINRSEFIRDLVRDALANEMRKGDEEVAGTITMLYDHHTSDLTRKLDDVQHEYTHEIIATMHIHLDHSSCLEIITLRGKASKIQTIADQLMGIKGVTQGKLTLTTTGNYLDAHADEHAHSHSHSHTHTHNHAH